MLNIFDTTGNGRTSTASCNLCDYDAYGDDDELVKHAMVWHVYDDHRDVWVWLMGDRPPKNPR